KERERRGRRVEPARGVGKEHCQDQDGDEQERANNVDLHPLKALGMPPLTSARSAWPTDAERREPTGAVEPPQALADVPSRHPAASRGRPDRRWLWAASRIDRSRSSGLLDSALVE